MARIVRGPEPYAPTGGLNIFGTLLKQQLSESSQMRMMRERAGLREQMDIRGETRKETQKWEAQRDQAAVTRFRDDFSMLDLDPVTREQHLTEKLPGLWDNLSQQKMKRFGTPANLRLAIERPLTQEEHERIVTRRARLPISDVVERRKLKKKRARTTEDRIFDKQTATILFDRALQNLPKDLPLEEADKRIREFARKFGLSKKYIAAIKRGDIRETVRVERDKIFQKQLDSISSTRSTNAAKMAQLVKVIPRYAMGSTSQKGFLQAVFQLATTQQAMNNREHEVQRNLGWTKQQLIPYTPDPATRNIIVAQDNNTGAYNTTDFFWHGDVTGRAEETKRNKNYAKFMVGKKNPTTLFELLSGRAPAGAGLAPPNKLLAAPTTSSTVKPAAPAPAPAPNVLPGAEPEVVAQILSAGEDRQPAPPSRAVSELLFNAPGLSTLDKAGNDAATAEQLRIALTGIGVDFSTIKDTYELIARFKQRIGKVVPEDKNIKNFGRLLTLVSRHKDAILSGVTR
jgi:hypothetical protein